VEQIVDLIGGRTGRTGVAVDARPDADTP